MDSKQRFKRQVATKVRIESLSSGKIIEKGGRKFLETKYGEELSRVRVMATVVGKFISEDSKFASITLDDGTDTIRGKGWQDISLIEALSIGDLIDLIGKVREYNDEIYLVPEIIQKIEDPNLELLRKLELQKKFKDQKPGDIKEVAEKEVDIRQEVIKLIESKKEVAYTEILKAFPDQKEQIEAIIDDLLGGGICYEPTPGKIRKI